MGKNRKFGMTDPQIIKLAKQPFYQYVFAQEAWGNIKGGGKGAFHILWHNFRNIINI